VPESVAVNVRGRPHTITAHVTVAADVEVVEGVLAVQGSVLGGWSFHLLGDGRLCYVHNLAGWRSYRVEAAIAPLAPGDHSLTFRFRGPAADLLVDGAIVGSGTVDRTAWSRFSLTGAGLTAGWSPDHSPADEDYRGRFAFTGTLHRVDIDVAGDPQVDPAQEAEDILSAQ
jgi:arylsulfatase